MTIEGDSISESAWQKGKPYINRSVLLLMSPELSLGTRSHHILYQECISLVPLRNVVTELQFNNIHLLFLNLFYLFIFWPCHVA